MSDRTADQIADQINATYSLLSAQYQVAIAAENAAWIAVGAAAGPAQHQALTDAAERITADRRALSAELDTELTRLNASASAVIDRITRRG